MGKTTPLDRENRRKKSFWFGVKALLAIGLIGYLLRSGKIDLETLRVATPSKIVVAQLFWFSAFLLTVLRWRLLLIALGVPHRFRDTLRLSGLGLCFSQVIPGATGGDLVRGVQIRPREPRKGLKCRSVGTPRSSDRSDRPHRNRSDRCRSESCRNAG